MSSFLAAKENRRSDYPKTSGRPIRHCETHATRPDYKRPHPLHIIRKLITSNVITFKYIPNLQGMLQGTIQNKLLYHHF